MRNIVLILLMFCISCSCKAQNHHVEIRTDDKLSNECDQEDTPIYIYSQGVNNGSAIYYVKENISICTTGKLKIAIVNKEKTNFVRLDPDRCKYVYFKIKGINESESGYAIGPSFGYSGLSKSEPPMQEQDYVYIMNIDLRKGIYYSLRDLPSGRYEVTIFLEYNEVKNPITVIFEKDENYPFPEPYNCEDANQKERIIKVE